ncbi:Dolichyl-diphosphooligosaccharide-protein glycosyltransferase subunit dad1 [Scheffersomyces spartinae]|uniref:Dolichyl-diphosphooligosaccharide--protein glycosyltransferase subunit OST2 n=1 Tax=Scheffersomyces spartinae TaxID=45513 RepID=A0A9P8AFX0_9ASCO|nr:Dolichyl-diphosphooligosaccharide-protein glycosyltransferase subunit dad1 [Scheffersomyces spartinae]KAG7191348.1 Dolichyl-diphosphooligosaccharide-protein glycosyltransferase subunit dad1 [Scheffersomyces spartinae]
MAKEKVPTVMKEKTGAAYNPLTDVTSALKITFNDYFHTLTPRLKLIDTFLAFLVALGILQFVYVVLIGNFPFNAFLGGFCSCVGQFVLTVSLRLHLKESMLEENNESDTPDSKKSKSDEDNTIGLANVGVERTFADFLFASLILHFIVYHFIN